MRLGRFHFLLLRHTAGIVLRLPAQEEHHLAARRQIGIFIESAGTIRNSISHEHDPCRHDIGPHCVQDREEVLARMEDLAACLGVNHNTHRWLDVNGRHWKRLETALRQTL